MKPLEIKIVLPPKAAALFVAACALQEKTPHRLAWDALHSEALSLVESVGTAREIARAFAYEGKEEA